MTRVVLVVVLALSGAGCGNLFVVTDSFTPPVKGDPPDSLHDYAVGTDVAFTARATRPFVDMNHVKVVSKNPDLVTVVDQSVKDGVIHATLHALKEGTAAVDFLDADQRPLEERVIEVKLPDEIDLAVDMDPARGYTLPALDEHGLVVAAGGKVTFRVTYKKKGAEVKGKGVLVGDTTLLTVENPTKAAPDREFVTLIAPPAAAELGDVKLKVADQVITTLSVRIADLAEIATIQIDEGAPPTVKLDGDVYTLWAKAFTKDAVPVFGAPFSWSFDSAPVSNTPTDDGDFLSYTYEAGARRLVQVGSGDAVNTITVEAKQGTALPGDNAAGCAQAPASLLALVGLIGLLRSRGARRGTLPS